MCSADSTYSSGAEDSEPDPDRQLGAWLHQLHTLEMSSVARERREKAIEYANSTHRRDEVLTVGSGRWSDPLSLFLSGCPERRLLLRRGRDVMATLWSPGVGRRRRLGGGARDEDALSDAGIDLDDGEGLESVPSSTRVGPSNKLTIPTPRMDTYRFSMANMEDSQDVELDAILGELCALEDKLDREMLPKSQSAGQALNGTAAPHHQPSRHHQRCPKQTHSRSNSGGGGRPKFEIGGMQEDMYGEEFLSKSEQGLRTDSPDNDSAFSDNVSMLSSESSASSGGARGEGGHCSSRSMSSQSSCMSLASSPIQVEQAARMKAEKIKIALEKMKEASIRKLFIKAFSADNSAKSLMIDERMTVGQVCRLLADKNHVSIDPTWALVEHIPQLYIERAYEDHELVVDNLLLWTRDSSNRLFFLERHEKYDLFINPQDYLLGGTSSEKNMHLDDEAKNALADEFFSTSNVGVPEVEGHLYLKTEGKKAWKKHFFVLRASGLYYCPKGKSKFSKDLLCLTTFDMNNVYLGYGWKKKYKSPSDFGFAIKHPQIQTKSSKYIKYLCAEDESALKQWVMGIRIAKYGLQMKENYENLLRDIAEEDLESLANARSFSVSSVAKTSNNIRNVNCSFEDEPPTTLEKLHKLKVISRRDSIKSSKSNTSSSSGCPSERSSGTPTTDHLVFEADFPMGTIKRKPSMTPKIPLTTTTRNLAKQSGDELLETTGVNGSLSRSTYGRYSLRRSHTDDRISVGSLSRRKHSFQETPPSTLLPDLPLPPPPPEVLGGSSECLNFDTLPPPPPEAFRNGTLEKDNSQDGGWKDTLPPPVLDPSPTDEYHTRKSPVVPPKPRKGLRRRQSESDANREHHLVVVRPKPPSKQKLKLHLEPPDPVGLDSSAGTEDEVYAEPSDAVKRSHHHTRISVRNRRTSAPCEVSNQLSVMSPSTPTSPRPSAADRRSRSQFKPSPPKRNENTKLSAFTAPQQRRSSSASAAPYNQDPPPESFLRNLQKVMVRKWKVAQQLTMDNGSDASHEILGFRDPNGSLTSPAEKVKHRSPSSPPPVPTHNSGQEGKSRMVKKQPPPPPPKKSDPKLW